MNKPGGKGVILGFLTVRPTAEGLRGGYLLLTEYGRPVEFHYTSEFRLAGPQRLLFGSSPPEYLYVELFAQPLTNRQSVAPRIVLVDCGSLLDLRKLIPAPVVLLTPQPVDTASAAAIVGQGAPLHAAAHAEFADDLLAFEKIRSLTSSHFDWLEPFERLGQALEEIRDGRTIAA